VEAASQDMLVMLFHPLPAIPFQQLAHENSCVVMDAPLVHRENPVLSHLIVKVVNVPMGFARQQ